MDIQDRINEAAADVAVTRERQLELRNKIVHLALQGKPVAEAAAELKLVMSCHAGRVRFQNDLIRQQLKETFG